MNEARRVRKFLQVDLNTFRDLDSGKLYTRKTMIESLRASEDCRIFYHDLRETLSGKVIEVEADE